MKIPRLGFFGLIILALTIAAPPAGAQTGEDLYQRALVLERSNGEVREAIQLYERIVRDFASDRTLAARALLRLGMAHEILGNAEARMAYERGSRPCPPRLPTIQTRSPACSSRTARAAASIGCGLHPTVPGSHGPTSVVGVNSWCGTSPRGRFEG